MNCLYDVYTVYWALDRKTLELLSQTQWAGYDYNYERKAAFYRLPSQIITFHKEFQERKAEKARKEAEEREEGFNI